MKNLTECLKQVNERKDVPTNFYIMNCGAMNGYKNEIDKCINGLVNVYIFDADDIYETDGNVKKINFEGPHVDKWDHVIKATKEHLDELSFIITC